MTQPTISIILPVYNKERYIKQCISSILQQNYTDFELIVINDGSTDNSGIEIQQAVLNDQRVQIIQYENAGVSVARNRGMEHATGKYLLFIDADDWIEENYLATLVEQLKTEADIYIWGITKEINHQSIQVIPSCQGKFGQQEFLELFIKDQYQTKIGLFGYISNKLIRATVVKDNNIQFNPKFKQLEDYDFYLSCYTCCQTFVCFPYAGYHYVCGAVNSSGQMIKRVDYLSLIDIHYKCYSLLEKKQVLTVSNQRAIHQAMGQLTIASFLEMQDVSFSQIKFLWDALNGRKYPLQSLPDTQTSHTFLKAQIQSGKLTILSIYLLIWRSYLLIKRYLS